MCPFLSDERRRIVLFPALGTARYRERVCDTLVVVGTDRVLFAKNSDRDPNEAQVLDWQPRRSSDGARLSCTSIEIDDVPETNAVLLSRPFWMWGAEMGTNEHGVTIGNEAVFTTEPYADAGLTGMDLLRLGLERAPTAERAVEVMIELLERYGQGGGCGHEKRSFTYHNSFIVADPTTAIVFETAGQKWATEVVASGPRSISNGLTISDFAEAHSDYLKTRVSRCTSRRALTTSAANAATGPADLAAALREHGGPAPSYSLLTGAMGAPCMHAGGLAAASQTTASWIAELAPAETRHWATGTAAPCTALFKPVAVDQAVDTGHDPTDVYDDRTLWWRHERLHRAALTDPTRLLPRFADERDRVEREWFDEPPPSAAAFAEGDRLLEGWTAAVVDATGADKRPRWVRRYWDVRARRASMREPVAT